MPNDEAWITDGKGPKAVADRDDAWVRAQGPRLIDWLRARTGPPDLRGEVVRRIRKVADPGLLRELFLISGDANLFEGADPKTAADVLLSFPKGTKEYASAVRRSAYVSDLRLLPLYADGLRIPRFERSSNLFFTLTGIDHPDVLRLVLDFLAAPGDPAWTAEDQRFFATERIHLTRHVFKRALEAAKRGADFPKEVHEALTRARTSTAGRDRCMLTMAGVALGRAEGVEDLSDAMSGCMWEQETWYEPLCRSRHPVVTRFVARMVAEERLYMHKALEYNPEVAPLIVEEARKVPDETRLNVLSHLVERAKGAAQAEARRILDEMTPARLLPTEFPLRTKGGDLVVRESPTRVVLSCAGCGKPAAAVIVSSPTPGLGHVWTYEGPFRKSTLHRGQSLAFLAALPAGSPTDVARSLQDAMSTAYRDMDPCCRDCGLAYCKACWKSEQTGTSGGSDIGIWYADYSATCPKGHSFEYSLATQNYG